MCLTRGPTAHFCVLFVGVATYEKKGTMNVCIAWECEQQRVNRIQAYTATPAPTRAAAPAATGGAETAAPTVALAAMEAGPATPAAA
jgi:hypothetical protein